MANKKYELVKIDFIKIFGITLYRIRALRSFSGVSKGDIGGYIEKETNLSATGNCWVGDKARVYDNARVYGNAQVFGNAKVYDNAEVYGKARVFGQARVYLDDKITTTLNASYNTKKNSARPQINTQSDPNIITLPKGMWKKK